MVEGEEASTLTWFQAYSARALHVEIAPPSQQQEDAAFEHLRDRARASAEAFSLANEIGTSHSHEEIHELVKSLWRAGKLSWEQFVFATAIHAERVHSDRISGGTYDSQLGPVNQRLREIEREEGLEGDEYWPSGQGPEEWNCLQTRWSEICESHFDGILRELGLHEVADARLQDQDAYDRAREAGRRNIHHTNDQRNAVANLLNRHEQEAEQASLVGAHYAAVAMFGAACEARLLVAVIDHREDADEALKTLAARERPRGEPMTWTLDGLIKIARSAGWLAAFEGDDTSSIMFEWAQKLKAVRNLLHPGRQVLEDAHVVLGNAEVMDARASYVLISSALSHLAPPPARPR